MVVCGNTSPGQHLHFFAWQMHGCARRIVAPDLDVLAFRRPAWSEIPSRWLEQRALDRAHGKVEDSVVAGWRDIGVACERLCLAEMDQQANQAPAVLVEFRSAKR